MSLGLLFLLLLVLWSVYYRWSRRGIYQLSKQIKCDLNTLPFIGHAHLFLGGGTETTLGYKSNAQLNPNQMYFEVSTSYTAVMLSRHQDVQEKVYQEVMEVLGETDRPIVSEDLPRLKYLDAVIRETLRLYPPVPIIVRKVQADVDLPSGITLVKGCGIAINIWGVQRDPKYWGPDAEDFRPERFFEHYDRRAFMAFSSGPRNCLGYQYAMMSMKTALASLIRQYRVLPAEEDIIHDGLNTKYKPIQETFEMTVKDVNNFRVKLTIRK